ncbi:MAG: pilus assembly protein TadG-related protein [Rhodothermales bacterium]
MQNAPHLQLNRRKRSRGQIIIMVAALAVSLTAMIGLAVDLGVAFAEKRTVQSAADSAALAGAHVLASWSTSNPGLAAGADVAAMVSQNKMGATVSQTYDCYYVDDNDDRISDCANAVPSNATGVHIAVTETHDTYFIRVVPGAPKTVSTSASATAHVQAVGSGVGSDSPFILCGAGAYLAGGGTMSILTTSAEAQPSSPTAIVDYLTYSVSSSSKYQVEFLKKKTTPTPSASSTSTATGGSGSGGSSTYKITSGAYGKTFILHDSQVAGCDTQGNRFKGVAANDDNYGISIPGLFDYDHGDRAGPTRARVAGVDGCDAGTTKGTADGCVLIVPIASGSVDDQLSVQTVGAFLVSECSPSGNCHEGTLLSNYVIGTPSGLGEWDGSGGWAPGKGGIITVRITE